MKWLWIEARAAAGSSKVASKAPTGIKRLMPASLAKFLLAGFGTGRAKDKSDCAQPAH